MKTPREILTEKKIKITPTKVDLLSLMICEERAFSFTEIMHRLLKPCHKTSLYRILSALASHRIVDKIVDSEGTAYFIFNPQPRSMEEPSCQPYFKCNFCGKVKKISQLPSLNFESWLMKSGQIESIYLLVEGRCSTCI